jgi:transcriptional regulator GlxA family with amidase domain
MNRRDLLKASTAIALATSFPKAADAAPSAGTEANPLHPPADEAIPVAFVISDGAVVIDFAGPWEVFENVMVPGRATLPFQLYTVAETMAPVKAGGGMMLVPNYSLATAPAPKVIVIPAQDDPSDAVIAWIRNATNTTDLTMSVCTGAFVLAKTGLLSGKPATTHHAAYMELAMAFPEVSVKRGARFVEWGNIASSGGLSSGIDLALHVVERYFGRSVALSTADNLEYQGKGWLDANSNQIYANRRVSTAQHPLCAVCDMAVDPKTAPKSVYHSKTYYFCMPDHKQLFDANPARALAG